MDGAQLIKMDVHMLLSFINMKLRDEFTDLDSLCDNFNIHEQELLERLKIAGYAYNNSTNQFVLI